MANGYPKTDTTEIESLIAKAMSWPRAPAHAPTLDELLDETLRVEREVKQRTTVAAPDEPD